MHHRLGPSSKSNAFALNAASRTKKYDGKIAGLYDLEETLGRGHFAVVKLARHVFTGEKVAVKVIDKTKLDEVSKSHLFQEVRCMKLVQHPNVVRLYEVIDTATKLYLVLELGDGGDLYEYIMRHDTGLPEKVAKEYFSQIVKAISYCHQLHVVHRDLKPENVVFFKRQGIVKLTDFGFSNKFYPGQKLETSCGSLAYSAPEILLGDSYDAPAVDVWSLGVILYMLVCGQPPFQEANDSETLTMIMDCKYEIPLHVSPSCRKLISRMLVRIPDKRATLAEIANHPWVNAGKQDTSDLLPLISREHLAEEDHNLIVQKIVNGNIATKEEIQESLEKNEYNHITATYFLLAERKLKCKRQEQLNKTKRPEELSVIPDVQSLKTDNSTMVKPNLLNVPRTPGDLPQRSRKCSIVQEDEEDEDITSCAGREELGTPLNRRGSRSEGRLNFALQERLAEAEKKKPPENKCNPCLVRPNETTKHHNTFNKHVLKLKKPPPAIITTPDFKSSHYDTVVPISSNNEYPTIGEILSRKDPAVPRTIVNRPYEQRKTKFHKNRTASCSSSDASDEDSEKRKKRAQKLSTPTKTIESRRDSHDDSSDSQEPSSGTGSTGANPQSATTRFTVYSSKGGSTDNQENKDKNSNDRNERKNADTNFRRNHKNIRKRSSNTRLRESQSLNRITEVQEDVSQTIALPVAPPNTPQMAPAKLKNVGTKIFETLNKSNKKKSDAKYLKLNANLRISRRDTLTTHRNFDITKSVLDKTEACNKIEKFGIKKIRKYFQVHKKICIPIAGIFCQNGLYKAQSCSSLTKGKSQELRKKCRGFSVIRNDGDINQNDTAVDVKDINAVCNELSEICALHLQFAPATKCSFC